MLVSGGKQVQVEKSVDQQVTNDEKLSLFLQLARELKIPIEHPRVVELQQSLKNAGEAGREEQADQSNRGKVD